ncbi:hypothetical protein [Escherichia phage dw-ec]|nr:hypothetical protein [Escherichia phage BI-EHEC]UJQ43714.1 hypothetical protein [Escherichia phage dw-ec]
MDTAFVKQDIPTPKEHSLHQRKIRNHNLPKHLLQTTPIPQLWTFLLS